MSSADKTGKSGFWPRRGVAADFLKFISAPNIFRGKQNHESKLTKGIRNPVNSLCLALCLGSFRRSGSRSLFTTGCAGDRYTRSTGESIDDRSVESRVKNGGSATIPNINSKGRDYVSSRGRCSYGFVDSWRSN